MAYNRRKNNQEDKQIQLTISFKCRQQCKNTYFYQHTYAPNLEQGNTATIKIDHKHAQSRYQSTCQPGFEQSFILIKKESTYHNTQANNMRCPQAVE